MEEDGFVSPFIQDQWQVGDEIAISGPQGHLYYEPIRDEKKVLALAGGSGITPFMGMAYAIRDGYEDFDLTILYGSRKEEDILYRKELDAVAAACDAAGDTGMVCAVGSLYSVGAIRACFDLH